MLIFALGLRNLRAHRAKSVVVGFIMLGGSFLVVVALALLDGAEQAMERSVTGSLAGDFQLYDADARDPLVLLGSAFISVADVGRIEHYEEVQAALESTPEVQAVVPMGFDIGSIGIPGPLDQALTELRALARQGASTASVAQVVHGVRELVGELSTELKTRRAVAADPGRLAQQEATLAALAEDGFWNHLSEAPLAGLERLDTEVAPLADNGIEILFRYLGTDLDRFRSRFSGFELVKGMFVPTGKRGFLFSDRLYERRLKHSVARGLDELLEHAENGQAIADDPRQRARVHRVVSQWRHIARQLDPRESEAVRQVLSSELSLEGELPELLEAFLSVDDKNLRRRRELFYLEIAPRVELYSLRPGDTVTLRSFTRRGFLRSVNVIFYGTYSFRGLENSDLAGVYNLTDLETFRYLFGVMNPAEQAELDALRAEVGIEDLAVDEVEDALFGDGAPEVVAASEPSSFGAVGTEVFEGAKERGLDHRIATGALERGLVLNVAVLLAPGVRRDNGRRAIERALDAAGLELNISDWQASSGLIGQFIVVVRLVLYAAMGIIFLVAIIIINNALVTTTLERTHEIGTLRAMGAQRREVLLMFFLETLVLALAATGLGAAAGAGLVTWWGSQGLPAPSRGLEFVFGGPALYPNLLARHVVSAAGVIVSVGLLSTVYPAWLGARVPPVEAMQFEE